MAPPLSITKAFQWDLARQVERLDFLLQWLPRYAEWGYQELYLHLEDAIAYPSLPAVARSDAYSYAQFARLVEAATAAGIRVVPIVNLLGHTQYLIKVPGLRDLNELRDPSDRPLAHGQICPLHPRTLEIAEKLLRDMAPFCTAGKVHVGLDESFHLGQCPRCRAEVARMGLAGHFAAHVNRLHERTASFGLRLGLWADMLALLPAAIPHLPRDVIAYDWYYYPFSRHPHVELYNFAEVDLATPLQKQGIEYWGCPMNGAFRYEPLPVFGERMGNILSWWRRCRRVGAGGFLITSWEANRLAIELTTVVDAAAACLWLDPDVDDPREMLARGFARVFGGRKVGRLVPNAPVHPQGRVRRVRDNPPYPGRTLARIALGADKYAFAGYHRWQINDRWDVCAGREGVLPYISEEKALSGICRSVLARDSEQGARSREQGAGTAFPLLPAPCSLPPPTSPASRLLHPCPPALAASLAFRCYLAQRDVFVRSCAQAVFALRRLLAHGAAANHPPPRRAKDSAPYLARLRAEATVFAAALRAGRAAARAMWNRSRDPRKRGPNELMLVRDAERLREWRRWLGQAARDRDLIWQATPVCGAWQLQFTVHNFAPALQKVVVEQQLPNGSWKTLHALPLMEFRAQAARPRIKIRREFSVPVAETNAQVGRVDLPAEASREGRVLNVPLASPKPGGGGRRLEDKPPYPAATAKFPPLRLAVRGVGQLAISRVELTDGVIRHHARGWPPSRKKILGRPAPACAKASAGRPRRGLPAVDFEKNADAVTVTLSGQGQS